MPLGGIRMAASFEWWTEHRTRGQGLWSQPLGDLRQDTVPLWVSVSSSVK